MKIFSKTSVAAIFIAMTIQQPTIALADSSEFSQQCLTGTLKGLYPWVKNRSMFCKCFGDTFSDQLPYTTKENINSMIGHAAEECGHL